MSETPYDSILIVGFGGPEKPEDVMPFLENVTRGRNIPRARLLEVAEHYYHFGGRSPINDHVRELIDALESELQNQGLKIPIYWGNRNWSPYLGDTLGRMVQDERKHSLAIILSAYGSYSSCRQYLEDIDRARQNAGDQAPVVDKIRLFFNHPDFISANADRIREALREFPQDEYRRVNLVFTAHSIPLSMASRCAYESQLKETCRLVADKVGISKDNWQLVYQSRSGRPEDPWLEPDILNHLEYLKAEGAQHVLVHPVGFLSDHVEVLYDLDEEAKLKAADLGLHLVRSRTVGTHPDFVRMLVDLIVERRNATPSRKSVGQMSPAPDVCPADCCPAFRRPGAGDYRSPTLPDTAS